MYLFIFESIGTSELLMIGAVALIIFGPRKLPQMARTLGKAMAEFKNTTNEFKSTWEREVSFEEQNISQTSLFQPKEIDTNLNEQTNQNANLKKISPEIKEINASQFEIGKSETSQPKSVVEAQQTEKQNWL